MSEITVSTSQALTAIQAAMTKDSVAAEGRMALQLIESAAPVQQTTQVESPSSPNERMGQQINIQV